MLSNLLGNYTTSVNDLGAVTERDINQILRWNSVVPKAVEKCIHEIIEEKAYLRSDAEAVCAWDGSLTYAELDCLASHLTSHLLDLGVGPETRVGLCFDKSVGPVLM
jgi:non-ribosomal peptide synthetase component F